MKIAICIKQVPNEEVVMDWETGTLIRQSGSTWLNPYDRHALEAGLRIKEEFGGSITVFTMGPPSAKEVIVEAFSLGVDDGVLLTDRRFAGADVYATSYTLSQGMKAKGKFDLILCGQQTTDGDTAQVAPSIASWLEVPFVSWVKEITDIKNKKIMIKATLTSGISEILIETPCVLSIEQSANIPRMASIKGKIGARKKEVIIYSLENLADKNPKNYGILASPTQVVKVYPPENLKKIVPKNLAPILAAEVIKEEIRKLGGMNIV